MVQDKNKNNTAYLHLMMDSFKKIEDFTVQVSVPEAEGKVKEYLENNV